MITVDIAIYRKCVCGIQKAQYWKNREANFLLCVQLLPTPPQLFPASHNGKKSLQQADSSISKFSEKRVAVTVLQQQQITTSCYSRLTPISPSRYSETELWETSSQPGFGISRAPGTFLCLNILHLRVLPKVWVPFFCPWLIFKYYWNVCALKLQSIF